MSFRIRYVIRDHKTFLKIHHWKSLVTESEADRPERRNMLPNVHPEKLFLRFPSTILYVFCDIKWQKFQGRIWIPVRQDKQIFYVLWSIRRKARAHNFRINKNETSHASLASHGGRALWKGSPPPTPPHRRWRPSWPPHWFNSQEFSLSGRHWPRRAGDLSCLLNLLLWSWNFDVIILKPTTYS